jgi:Zn-dependent metalloprotease
VAQKQNEMLARWLGRDGQDGQGGSFPLRVGLQDQNAFFDGRQVQIGFNTRREFLGSADVLGHELSHAIDATTPGGIVDLIGNGPIRDMRDPSSLGADNCFSGQTAQQEVHDAAGPGNHWFFLLSQGTGGDGQGAGPTCDNSTITGLGIENAIKIMFNGMLLKNSNSSYPQYRVPTLQAAKTLFEGSCTEFDTVKAAWDAVAVPAQRNEPTCDA